MKAAAWACLGVALLAGPVRADLVEQDVRLRVQAGGYCIHPADGSAAAPETQDGEIAIYDRPYDFILTGDIQPALPDFGIGLVVDLESFSSDEPLTVEAFRFEDRAAPERWEAFATSEGRFWFGTHPDPGKGLAEGHYRFTVRRGAQRLFVYDFTLVAPEDLPALRRDLGPGAVTELALRCVPEMS